jgi:hypothetical protein
VCAVEQLAGRYALLIGEVRRAVRADGSEKIFALLRQQ